MDHAIESRGEDETYIPEVDKHMIPSTNEFLNLMRPNEKGASFLMGKIDPNYTSGNPKIVFDGETSASTKRYQYLKNYTPAANDRVLIAKVGGSCVVLGKI